MNTPLNTKPFLTHTFNLLNTSASLLLVWLGVMAQTALGPSLWGWALVAGGFALGLVTGHMRASRTPLDWPLGLLALMGALSLWVTAFPALTLAQVVRLWAGIAGYYALVFWAHGPARLAWVLVALLAAGSVLALVAPFVVQWSTDPFFIPPRVYALFPLLVSNPVHPNIIATLAVLLLPLPLAWLAARPPDKVAGRGARGKTVGLAAVGLMLFALWLLTKSRGGYIAGGIGIVLALGLAGRRKLAGLLVIVGIVAGAALWWQSTLQTPLPAVVEGSTDPRTLAFRLRVWEAALWVLADFPFTGAGMGAFNEVTPLLYPFYEVANPGAHNIYLQVGVDLGIPGLVAYLAMLGLTLGAGLRAYIHFTRQAATAPRAWTAGALAGMGAMLAHGLVDNTVWNTRAAFVPWAVIGLLVALAQCADKAREDQLDMSYSSKPWQWSRALRGREGKAFEPVCECDVDHWLRRARVLDGNDPYQQMSCA